MEWQPIDTAPKDGTWIILSGGKVTEDFYSDEYPDESSRPVIGAGFKGYAESFWKVCFWDGDWRTGYDDPVWWMPIPGDQP